MKKIQLKKKKILLSSCTIVNMSFMNQHPSSQNPVKRHNKFETAKHMEVMINNTIMSPRLLFFASNPWSSQKVDSWWSKKKFIWENFVCQRYWRYVGEYMQLLACATRSLGCGSLVAKPATSTHKTQTCILLKNLIMFYPNIKWF